MTNPPRPSRPDQPGQPGRPTDLSRPAPPSRSAAAGRPGRAPAQRIGGTAGAARGAGSNAGRGRGAAWGKVGDAVKRGGAGQRGPAQRASALRWQAKRGGAQRRGAQREGAQSATTQSSQARGGKRNGLASFFRSGALANKRAYLIIGAIVLVLIIVIAAVAHQRSSSTNAAATVTAITSTTVAGENRTTAPEADVPAGDLALTPDLSGLAMDPSTDPNAKAYFAALKRGGIPVKNGMETALLGMGYTHCQEVMSKDNKAAEVQNIMLETLVQLTPGVSKATAKKVIYTSSDKYLCPALKKRQ